MKGTLNKPEKNIISFECVIDLFKYKNTITTLIIILKLKTLIYLYFN